MNKLLWKVHTPNLLGEILNNTGTSTLRVPLHIFGSLLQEVATRASQLNDSCLNKLMLRLTLYEIADPESTGYNPERVKSVMEDKQELPTPSIFTL